MDIIVYVILISLPAIFGLIGFAIGHTLVMKTFIDKKDKES